MQVLITTDVELWPRNWNLSQKEMMRAFSRYILGKTETGSVGLPFQLNRLAEHELRGVFFIEPLFASVMGKSALEDVVGMVRDFGQEVQLHLHTEWMGRSNLVELPGPPRMSMKELDEDGQMRVIQTGLTWLEEAGSGPVTAFRAGAYGANRATLRALHRVGLPMDSSHNLSGPHGPLDDSLDDWPQHVDGVFEVPQTVYKDAFGCLRHVQAGSSSTGEIKSTLVQAREQNREIYVILSHSAELLTHDRERPDPLAVRRFEKLCRYLADHKDLFPTAGFNDLDYQKEVEPPSGGRLKVGIFNTLKRYGEQAFRRIY